MIEVRNWCVGMCTSRNEVDREIYNSGSINRQVAACHFQVVYVKHSIHELFGHNGHFSPAIASP